MNFHKHWKHFLLSSAALFWASCGGDSESASVTGGENNETPPDSIVKPDDIDNLAFIQDCKNRTVGAWLRTETMLALLI